MKNKFEILIQNTIWIKLDVLKIDKLFPKLIAIKRSQGDNLIPDIGFPISIWL